MRINLHRGYRSNALTGGAFYPAGEHDVPLALAKHLVDIDLATPLDDPGLLDDDFTTFGVDVGNSDRNVSITIPAQRLMDDFGLTIDDFPDVTEINKPMVDAVIEERTGTG